MSAESGLVPVEAETLAAFRDGSEPPPRDTSGRTAAEAPPAASRWAGIGILCMLEACRVLRRHASGLSGRVVVKEDGSPATDIERAVEEQIRARLRRFDPDVAFVGEETGGRLPDTGEAVAVDPVDGTWAFLTQTATWTVTLAVFRDGRPIAGFVANPTTAELAYAFEDGPTRCLRLAAFGEPDEAVEYAPPRPRPEKLLVNLHPTRAHHGVLQALRSAWASGELRMVRSPGGSPCSGLLEAARGYFVYVNLWSRGTTDPFDLAAGVLLVRGAGGEVTDLDGVAISPLGHTGPWIAGVDPEQRAKVTAIVKGAWPG
jgi:fructose-1,6-bisphosphatase/inositol monophosphatase family enzyme